MRDSNIHARPAASHRLTTCIVLLLLVAAATGCQLAAQGQNAEGVRMFQQAYYQGALQRFQQAIQSDPNNADAYYNLASTYHKLGNLHQQKPDLQQAEAYYHQCLDHSPNHQDCHRALAVLLVEQGRVDDAFKLLQGWSDRNPALPAPKIELARLYEEQGKRSEAEHYLVEAVTVDPNNARALAALGKLRDEAGNTAQALADYQRSLQINHLQPMLAARVASLQTSIAVPSTTPPGATRVVTVPPAPTTTIR